MTYFAAYNSVHLAGYARHRTALTPRLLQNGAEVGNQLSGERMMKTFLQSIAWNAHINGKTGAEFEAAAHRHGSAFWFYAIATAIVWWFAHWRWALIPAAIAVWTAWNAISASFVGHYMKEFERRMKDYDEKSQRQATMSP